MTVLRDVAKSLKTDLADIARASVDPVFSRQLTISQFEDRKHARNRAEALEDARRLQREKAAAEEQRQRGLMHMKLFEDAFDQLKERGSDEGAGPLVRLINQPGFSPLAKEFGQRAINARFKQGYAGELKRVQIDNAVQRMDNDNARLVLEERRIKNNEDQFLLQSLERKAKFDYEKAKDMVNENQSFINKEAFVQHIEQSKGLFTQEQLDSFRALAANGDEDAVKAGWNLLWDQARQKVIEEGKSARVKAEIEGRIPSGLTGNELRETSLLMSTAIEKAIEKSDGGTIADALDTNFVDFWFGKDKEIIKDNKKKVITATARIAKTFGRSSTDAADPFMADALQLSMLTDIVEIDGQLRVDPRNSLFLAREIQKIQQANPKFTLSRFVKSLEKSPNADPKDVLAEFKRQAGIQ